MEEVPADEDDEHDPYDRFIFMRSTSILCTTCWSFWTNREEITSKGLLNPREAEC